MGRELHSATLLSSGQVLVAGGYNNGNLSSTELYNPSTKIWTNSGLLNHARYGHTATLLPNGQVLVTGGAFTFNLNSPPIVLSGAELYTPTTGKWTRTGSMTVPRWQHTAVLLPNGKVLIAGGRNFIATNSALASAELYDPTTGKWTSTSSMNIAKYAHVASILTNGQVLVCGGSSETNGDIATLSSAELFDHSSNTWRLVGPMNAPRSLSSSTLLKNGQVLIAGGYGSTEILSSAELYVFSPLLPVVTLVKAVKPSFSNLTIGINYQLQISGDLISWTNYGTSFRATNSSMDYPHYWDTDWEKLFFRIQSLGQ